jgi:hypothetical protein
MESNPEEFFGDATKWRFMFAPNFREVLTEPEKGVLHEALKNVRRKEFDTLVLKELLKEEMEDTLTSRAQGRYATPLVGQASNSSIGLSSASNVATNTIKLGKETLSEEDVRNMKAASISTGWFK